MAKVRFRKDTNNSFFGNFLYSQVLPKDHFLVRMKEEIPWEQFTGSLIKAYKGGGEYGPTPYAPDKILRMLMVPYLFNISEREAEEVVRFNLLAKNFVGLGVDEIPPDHSTLTVFKDRLVAYQGQYAWELLFNKIIRYAKGRGITFGKLQIIDSTHTTADVNIKKDQQRKKEGKPPRDPGATFKTKGEKDAYTKKGQKVKIKDTIYGYKAHTSLNEDNNLITSLKITTAKEDDGKQFQSLVKKDLQKGVIKDGEEKEKDQPGYSADKGYDDGDNHEFLAGKKLHSAIILKATRLSKKDQNKGKWYDLVASPFYQENIKKRKRIEKKFGEEKKHHGLDRCRYLGLTKYAIQAYLTAIVVNLKQIMALTLPVRDKIPGAYCFSTG